VRRSSIPLRCMALAQPRASAYNLHECCGHGKYPLVIMECMLAEKGCKVILALLYARRSSVVVLQEVAKISYINYDTSFNQNAIFF
jgi:hypothetical protein